MNAADLTRLWAAHRLDIPVEKIERVEFVDEPGHRYSSWTVEPATQGANVYLHTREVRYVDTTDMHFGELLAELVSAGISVEAKPNLR